MFRNLAKKQPGWKSGVANSSNQIKQETPKKKDKNLMLENLSVCLPVEHVVDFAENHFAQVYPIYFFNFLTFSYFLKK